MTLRADSLELWSPANGYAFEIRRGNLKDLPAYRGENVTIPAKPGQTWMSKVGDHLMVVLHGEVMGDGFGSAAAASYLARMEALNAIIDPDVGLFTLTLDSGAEGLSTGEQATIEVEFQRWVKAEEGPHFRIGDIECICISDPPGWTITSGS